MRSPRSAGGEGEGGDGDGAESEASNDELVSKSLVCRGVDAGVFAVGYLVEGAGAGCVCIYCSSVFFFPFFLKDRGPAL